MSTLSRTLRRASWYDCAFLPQWHLAVKTNTFVWHQCGQFSFSHGCFLKLSWQRCHWWLMGSCSGGGQTRVEGPNRGMWQQTEENGAPREITRTYFRHKKHASHAWLPRTLSHTLLLLDQLSVSLHPSSAAPHFESFVSSQCAHMRLWPTWGERPPSYLPVPLV